MLPPGPSLGETLDGNPKPAATTEPLIYLNAWTSQRGSVSSPADRGLSNDPYESRRRLETATFSGATPRAAGGDRRAGQVRNWCAADAQPVGLG